MKKQILWLMAAILSMSMNAQTVSFEHNDSRSFQDNSNYAHMTLSSMSIPHSINTSSSNSDWAKSNLENYEGGNLPEGTDNYVQLMQRYNGAWWFATFFDWFTLEFTTPAYTQYKYLLHFQLSTLRLPSGSHLRAALFNYGTDYDTWSGRVKTPNGQSFFYTSHDDFSWSENKPGEACAVRQIGAGTVTNTCVIPLVSTNNGTSTTDKAYYGFSSCRDLAGKNENHPHYTYLKACYTAEFVGYVKHIVYNPNTTGISAQSRDIVNSGAICDNLFGRPGYTLLCWNAQADDRGRVYNVGDSIFVDEATKGELVLYAQWKVNNYTVTFDKQNGEGGTDSVVATYDAAMPTITVPTREDHTFLGYYTQPNGGGVKYYNADGTGTRNWDLTSPTTLYAHWKEEMIYIDEDGTKKTVNVFRYITDTTTTLSDGWYVVSGEDVQTGMIVCKGAVHLILKDDAKLTATGDKNQAGVQVSDENASLTIYGQTKQSGQLIANGGERAAGIGGAYEADGHDITINGGVIVATAGYSAAGIGAGVKGGCNNIRINWGKVTATGGMNVIPGIGYASQGTGVSNIYVRSSLTIYADTRTPPTQTVRHTSEDDLSLVFGSAFCIARYIVITPDAPNSMLTGPNAVPTDVEEVDGAECKKQTVKYLRDGVLYIERDGRTYNAHGMLVK